jgi:hypothetical protein
MLVTPQTPPRRRRGPLPVGPLQVTDVVSVTTGTEIIQVTLAFNTTEAFPLSPVDGPEAPDPSRWRARYNGFIFIGTLLERMSFNTLRVTMVQDDPQAGANVISVTGTDPTGIFDALGRELAPFANLAI